MNHVNAATAPSSARLSESLPSLIEEIDNELAILEKSFSATVEIADRLHGTPPRPSTPLSAVAADPDGLLSKLRTRVERLNTLNSEIVVQLGRVKSCL